MLAKKDKNPRVIFEDSGITEDIYVRVKYGMHQHLLLIVKSKNILYLNYL